MGSEAANGCGLPAQGRTADEATADDGELEQLAGKFELEQLAGKFEFEHLPDNRQGVHLDLRAAAAAAAASAGSGPGLELPRCLAHPSETDAEDQTTGVRRCSRIGPAQNRSRTDCNRLPTPSQNPKPSQTKPSQTPSQTKPNQTPSQDKAN
jgi:hypothetical protein